MSSRQTSVDDFVVAKASKNPTDQQFPIQIENQEVTAKAPKYLPEFLMGHLAWAQRVYSILHNVIPGLLAESGLDESVGE